MSGSTGGKATEATDGASTLHSAYGYTLFGQIITVPRQRFGLSSDNRLQQHSPSSSKRPCGDPLQRQRQVIVQQEQQQHVVDQKVWADLCISWASKDSEGRVEVAKLHWSLSSVSVLLRHSW